MPFFPVVFTFVLTLSVWLHHAVVWWPHMEGDAPLYPLMSLRVLQGHHVVMTVGQHHGGTFLVYLRALLFWIFGVGHELAFVPNGLAMATGAALWARWVQKYHRGQRDQGVKAALVFGVLVAFMNERMVRAACTDYFALTMVTSGLILNFSDLWISRLQISLLNRSPSSASAVFPLRATTLLCFLSGGLVGVSWYVCRFSMLYLCGAFSLGIMALGGEKVRFPILDFGTRDLRKLATSTMSAALGLLLVLVVVAFFTDDRFLGINAEKTLKWALALAGATSILAVDWKRWDWGRPAVRASLAVGTLGFLGGLFVGYLPEILFKLYWAQGQDRTTGLVRWSDIWSKRELFIDYWGQCFSFYHRKPWGFVLGAASVVGAILLGLTHPRLRGPLVLMLVPLGAWFGIHTYMHMSPQYFFPVWFPLCAFWAVAWAQAKGRWMGFTTTFIVGALVLSGLFDLHGNRRLENIWADPELLQSLDEVCQKYSACHGYGPFPSNYNVTWSTLGKVHVVWQDDVERFIDWQEQVRKSPTVFWLRHEEDRGESWLPPVTPKFEKVFSSGFRLVVWDQVHLSR